MASSCCPVGLSGNLPLSKSALRASRRSCRDMTFSVLACVASKSGLFALWLIYRQCEQHLFVLQMSDRLQQLSVFIRTAEGGSFSRAAQELGLSQPSVSRIVGELEQRLGVTLLLRTTRRITVTDAGALFLERAREILAEIEDAEDAARGVDSLRGIIRLAMPVVYGTREIIPRLPKFLAMHPLLRVEMQVVDARQDLVAEGSDVAVRLGDLDDSSFGARKLATLPTMLVATPSYLAARGTPKTPADLASHDCIAGPGHFFGRDSW